MKREVVSVAVAGRRQLHRDIVVSALANAPEALCVLGSFDSVDDAVSCGAESVVLCLADGSGLAIASSSDLSTWNGERPSPVRATVLDWDIEPDDLVMMVGRTAAGTLPTIPTAPLPCGELTARETEILGLLGAGWDPNEISVELGVSSHTVRTHLERINAKLGVHSRLEAACLARRHGLVSIREGRLVNAADVLIASKQPLVSHALLQVAETDGLQARHCDFSSGLSAVLESSDPDVVAVDFLDSQPGQLDSEFTSLHRDVSSPRKGTPILLLAEEPPIGTISALARNGVRGVFTPDTALSKFPTALRRLAEGEAWFTRSAMSQLLAELAANGSGPDVASPGGTAVRVADPTPRETTVLELLAEGCDHHQIAKQLGLSPHTARTHIRNIMKKLGVHSRSEAVHVALRTGLLDTGRSRNTTS